MTELAAVIAAAKGGEDARVLPEKLPRSTEWLSREERGLIEFLEADTEALAKAS